VLAIECARAGRRLALTAARRGGCNRRDALVVPLSVTTVQHRAASLSTRGPDVNKTDMIDHIATQADISKAAAARALDAFVGGVKTALKKGSSVSLVGFGTFTVTRRQARTGRNPRTKEPIKIKAAKVPKFRPGKALKDSL
jgi:DNA-binding protein HU-beta